jgi:hypothetical protein
MTVAAWVKLDTNTTQDTIAYETHNTSPWFSWHLAAYSTNFQLELNDAAGRTGTAWTALDPQPNTWYHMVGVYQSGSTPQIYINGADNTAGTSGSVSGPLMDTDGGLNVSSNSATSFDGQIDDVRIYSRVLTASEIQTLYNDATPTPTPSPSPSTPPSACHLYTSSSAIPAGFGSPYDVLSSPSTNLMNVTCETTSARIDLGKNDPLQYIYNTGYLFKTGGTAWTPISYTSAESLIANAWYPKTAPPPCL